MCSRAAEDQSLPRLLVLNMAACGCELGLASITTMAPPMLRRHNFSETSMSATMGIGPFLALLTIPALGRWSDGCTSRWGRRRPFLLVCILLMLLGVTCLPNAEHLSAASTGLLSTHVVLTVSVVCCTFAAHVFYNPYQALISDICRSEQSARRGFAVFVFMISCGSIASNLLFSWDWFPGSVLTSQRTTFGVIAALMSVQTAVTLVCIQEPPARVPASASALLEDVGYASDSSGHDSPVLKNRCRPVAPAALPPTVHRRRRLVLLFISTLGAVTRLLLWPANLVRRIYRLPMVLRRLFLVDLMSWMALTSFYVFITDYLGQAFGGRAEDPEGSEGRIKFDAGVQMGAKCLLIDGISASVISLLAVAPLTRWLGTRTVYVLFLTTFSGCLVIMSLTSSAELIYVLCAVMGCGYSAVGNVPNTLVTLYHYQPEVFLTDRPTFEPAVGLGENFAVLDMSCCLSSILTSLTLGYLVDMFAMPHLYVLVGGVIGLMSAALATTLVYKADEMPPLARGSWTKLATPSV